ncbi:UNVERIFIED_CONTAM: Transcription factor [Sesamum latifolium]|uniref:Transcription factor n=1 Tax=Sesamum latifolium TaxID=2727402 RepID=A0AAW2UXP1_9LAMI
MGLDPITHKPKNHALDCNQPKDIANLNHMTQWESARLEAEARIVSESKLVSDVYHSTTTSTATTTVFRRTKNTMLSASTDGVVREQSFASDIINYVESPGACAIGRISDNNHQDGDQVKGIMENSLEIHDMIADWLRYPSFLEGFTDLPPGPADNAVSEDNKISYWNSILTNSQMDLPVF